MAFMCGLIVWLRIVYPMHATFVAIFFLVCWMNGGYVESASNARMLLFNERR
jgi:hypothetical protein